MSTTIRIVDNYMSESILLDVDNQTLRIGPHDRLFVDLPVPVCEDEASFRGARLELRIVAKDQRIRFWESAGSVRFARDGVWRQDAEAVPKLCEVGGGRGIVVGAMGGFWFKRVNV